jgi:hypothetical protein
MSGRGLQGRLTSINAPNSAMRAPTGIGCLQRRTMTKISAKRPAVICDKAKAMKAPFHPSAAPSIAISLISPPPIPPRLTIANSRTIAPPASAPSPPSTNPAAPLKPAASSSAYAIPGKVMTSGMIRLLRSRTMMRASAISSGSSAHRCQVQLCCAWARSAKTRPSPRMLAKGHGRPSRESALATSSSMAVWMGQVPGSSAELGGTREALLRTAHRRDGQSISHRTGLREHTSTGRNPVCPSRERP